MTPAGGSWRGDLGDLLGPPWSDSSRLGRPFAKDPSVVRFGGRYLLYYSLPPASVAELDGFGRGWDVGIAAGDDLVRWQPVGALGRIGPDDERGRAAPGAVVLGGRVHLFVQTYGNGAGDAICHAVSDDGIHFSATHGGRPVFRPRGRWSSGRAIDADATVFGDRVVLGYATRDPAMRTQLLGFATAPLGSDLGPDAWTDESLDGPALAPSLGWERDCIEAPALCVREGRLVAFYAGGYNNAPQQIGAAVSDDARTWTRVSDQPIVRNGAPGSWNSSESGHPGLLVEADGSADHLFFQGNPDGGHTWSIAAVRVGWDGVRPVVPQRRG